ncbi:NLRP2 isoform 10 [Pan troglodytes]|uniref:NLRP2 isoform 10 n=4 Tax=Pan troglodytes TaxID=9598 RepID=A0A663DB63_PANTR|nr:NACHT, LRR and PYD domains-containing protein 2 [Pan troglodytes]PNI15091.1 NLRP2 isoform 3 [Pan troglodytes]PNI15092.1 NLRP2 isoform 4 [Pan troglodytes]PNI15093.1 NLRP2 isoform 5 [Pan troglodytes]PNI15095.1 NLRP2 isoform 7 [Pan troglodytes]PNI15097.1 NLRP2 isoform 10 [Pan troglodytes]
MVSSAQMGFNLQALLEQLSQDELSKFKYLITTFSLAHELQKIPHKEVDKADGKQLVEILTSHCDSYWVEMASLQVFEKMHRMDLSERAKDEVREAALKSFNKRKPLSLGITRKERPPLDVDEMLERLKTEALAFPETKGNVICLGKDVFKGKKPDKDNRCRYILKTKFREMWKSWPGDSKEVQVMAERYKMLIPFSNPRVLPGPFSYTVVLYGPAGLGKTTLAQKLMLDWAEDNLIHKFKYAFYLSCRELSRLGPCSFAELVFRDWPELQDDIPHILAQARKILFVIDGFDELGAAPGALIEDICGDWEKKKPVPVLLGSLLNRVMLPKAALLVTTRPRALRDLRILAEEPIYVRVEGFLEEDRRAYFLRHFGDEDRAMRAFELMRSNADLFQRGSAPAVCWIVCTTLKLQMEKGEDPVPTCLTRTGLFLRFLCSRFPQGAQLRGALRTLSLLAAQGLWAQTSVLHREDLERLGVQESDLRLFLDGDILRQDRVSKGCYSFIHLSFQQFLTALFYALEKEEEEDRDGHTSDIGDVQKLLSGVERLRNPDLIQAGYYYFGLANEKRAKELEATFGCRMSPDIKQELLRCDISCKGGHSTVTDLQELLGCLYESQEEELVKEVMAQFKEISLHLNAVDVVPSSFCVKHCRNLQKMSLQVIKENLPENVTASESDAEVERSQDDQHMLPFWTDLCSIFGSNKDLMGLAINDSFLSASLVRILCEQIASDTCHLQRVVFKNISPADAHRNLCLALRGHKTVTYLTLQGNDQDDMFPALCEVLRHPECNLRYLGLVSCSATTQQWADLSLALEVNQSLTCVNLSDNELLDEGAKLLYTTLRHPKCFLQRLSLENCHLTEANCKDLAAVLVVSRELTHLCLAKNPIGNTGVKFLCEGLRYPECKLQTLVLWNCDITSDGCCDLAKLLQEKSSLSCLDLGLNHIGVKGMKFLCEALRKPLCNLRCLWLWGCSIPPFSCEDLCSALSCNQSLVTLDLGQNPLGSSGVKMLFETLTCSSGTLRTLRLKIDDFNDELNKLLEEIEEKNPQLIIDTEKHHPWEERPSSHDFMI